MPGSIKILHVLHAFSAGGLENGIVNLINRSPEKFQHELCLLTRGGDFLNRLKHPVVYYELHKQPGNDLSIFLRIREILSKSKADIVHTCNWAAFDGVLASCLAPRVTLLHGEYGRHITDPEGLDKRKNLLRRLFRFRVRKFVVVSENLHRWLMEVVGLPREKLVFIPNGVDTERFQPSRGSGLRQELGIGRDEFVVGSIGRLDPVKNHLGLLRAVEILSRQGIRVRLVIVGDGPEHPRLEEFVRSKSIEPAPILLGYRSDVPELYRLFDLFVLNSIAEGMSNTLLEAMASALPIICTAVGGNVELVADGERGRWVPVANDEALAGRISEYLQSVELRRAHGHESRKFVESRFSLRQMVERYLDLYQAAVRPVRGL